MKTLIIPDIHQDLVFLDSVFERFDPLSFDSTIFLGDYFWSNKPELHEPQNFRRFCSRFSEIHRLLGDAGVFLCGNRDLPYLLSSTATGVHNSETFPGYIRDFYHADCGDIAKETFPQNFWQSLRCAFLSSGWLFSHAGLSPRFLPDHLEEGAIDRLNERFRKALQDARSGDFSPLLQASKAKNGPLERGGPLWQLFDTEFEDELELPQIVGHTRGEVLRTKGRSHCIDCEQSAVAIVSNGSFEFCPLD